MKTSAIITTIAAIAMIAGCQSEPGAETVMADARIASPQDEFFARLSQICGQAFPGRLVSDDAVDADMAGKQMIMHVAKCSDSEIKIPFHIETAPGIWDRSRTWIITRTGIASAKPGLRLKHEHRHEDGSADAVTFYGGDTTDQGTASRQSFPVDADSIALFTKDGPSPSAQNIWAIEIDELTTLAPHYTYELSRENRLFRVQFDLDIPMEAPPLPWGWDG